MGVLKLIVTYMVILFVTADDWPRKHDESTTLLNIRLKRETEIDSKALIKPRILVCHKPSKVIIPVQLKNHINKPNILPRRKLVPIGINKPTTLKHITTKAKDDSRRSDDEKLAQGNAKKTERESPETNKVQVEANSIIATSNDQSDNIVAKPAEPRAKEMVLDPGLLTVENSLNNVVENNGASDVKNIINSLEPDTKTKHIEEDPVQDKVRKLGLEETETSTKPVVLMPETIPKKTPSYIFPAYKIVPGLRLEKNKTPAINENSETSPKNNTFNELPTKILPLSIISDKRKLTPLVLTPSMSVNLGDDQIKIGKTIDDASNSRNAEPEEIIIEHNNYEELYENFRPTDEPEILTSDFEPANYWYDINQDPMFPSCGKNYDEVIKPYSYSVTKYPGQYLVNPIFDDEGLRQNSEDAEKVTCNSNDKPKNPGSVWYQNYNRNYQPQSLNFGQTSFDYYNQLPQFIDRSNYVNQYQTYPNRIRRTWRYNSIHIRPRTAGNAPLYQGLGSFLANVNFHKVPASNKNMRPVYSYNAQNFSPRINEFQNASPANPFQRYGYYDKQNI